MKLVLAFVTLLVLAAPAPAAAQVVSVDLSAVGLPNVTYTSVETDGNLATREWMYAASPFSPWRVVVRVASNGAICLGTWFSVDGSWTLQRVGLVHEFTRTAWPNFERLPLSTYAPAGCTL